MSMQLESLGVSGEGGGGRGGKGPGKGHRLSLHHLVKHRNCLSSGILHPRLDAGAAAIDTGHQVPLLPESLWLRTHHRLCTCKQQFDGKGDLEKAWDRNLLEVQRQQQSGVQGRGLGLGVAKGLALQLVTALGLVLGLVAKLWQVLGLVHATGKGLGLLEVIHLPKEQARVLALEQGQ